MKDRYEFDEPVGPRFDAELAAFLAGEPAHFNGISFRRAAEGALDVDVWSSWRGEHVTEVRARAEFERAGRTIEVLRAASNAFRRAYDTATKRVRLCEDTGKAGIVVAKLVDGRIEWASASEARAAEREPISSTTEPLLYTELAEWWPLMSPPSHYDEEADDLLRLLEAPPGGRATLLELGCGGGSLASHLHDSFRLTLTDRSPGMLAVCRAVTPDAEHLVGDMRTLDLGRTFDRVLIHDPIMYMQDENDLRAALRTARRHCHPRGLVVLIPDCVKETFTPNTRHGGEDGADGRSLRYLEWTWDPDPNDTTIEALYAIVMRDAAGGVRTVTDRHRLGVFSRAAWVRWIEEAGFASPSIVRDRWSRDVFLARPVDHAPSVR